MLGKGNLVKTKHLFYVIQKTSVLALDGFLYLPLFFMKSIDFRFMVMLKLVILALEMTVRKF